MLLWQRRKGRRGKVGGNGTGGPWGPTRWNLKTNRNPGSAQSWQSGGFGLIDGAVQSLAGINREKSWQVPFNLKKAISALWWLTLL